MSGVPPSTTATVAGGAGRTVRRRSAPSILTAIGLFSILGLVAPGAVEAAISTQSAWASQFTGAAYPNGPVNASYTVAAGTNRLLVVAISSTATAAGAQTVSVTYGGRTLTLAAGDGGSTATWNHSYLYYLNDAGIAAAVGASLNVTITGGTSYYNWVYAAVYAGVDQTTPLTDAKNYNSNSAVSTAVGPFNPTLTIAANDQAIEIVNLARSTIGTAARTITTWATGWTTAGIAPASVATNGPCATMYIRDRNLLTAASDGSQHTASSANTWDSMTTMSMKAAPTVVNSTTAGTVTATATGCTAIAVTAPYTNDANGNNTLSYRYRTPSGSGTWQGPFTRTHSASPYSFAITGLTHGAAYDVEATYVDADGVTGTATQTVTNVPVGQTCTGAGAVTASQTTGATPSIAVSAPYAFDSNGDNTLSYRYRTPTGTGTWTAATPVAHGASPYAVTISSLACGSSYDVEVTYLDGDGIGSGTAVQTVSNVVLTNCTVTGTVTATGGSCGSIAVTAPYAQDADGDNTISYRYRTPTGTGVWTTAANLAHATSPYSFNLTGLAAGTYDIEVTYADADGTSGTNPRTVTNVTVSANCTTVGAAAATAVSCSRIDVSAPFTGDANANGTTTVEYNTTNTWPGTTACAGLTGASPRSCPVSGLANASAYYFRVTFADADGVSGANPQVIGPKSTQDCRVTPQAPGAVANACSQVVVTAPYSGDANGNSRTNVNRGTAPGGPYPAAVCSNLSGASPRTCIDGTVAASTMYYYQVTFTDADGVVGSASQEASVTTPPCAVNNTTAGALSAQPTSCNAVTASATFTGDQNGNGSTLFEYNTTNTWPGTAACAAASGASPRQCVVGGLTGATTYWFRATFSDPDGVAGTNPTAAISAATPACGGDTIAPTVTMLVPSRNAILSGADTAKVQVYDAGGLAATPVTWQVDGTGAGAYSAAGVAVNNNYACGTGCKVYEIAVPAQTAGSHYLSIRVTDAAGNNAYLNWAFRSRASGSGSGTILRRTHSSQLCLDCHNLQTHNSQYTSTAYGNWAIDCATCHTPHGTANIYLVRGSIETPASGVRPVDFRYTTGVAANSYATPTANGNGVNVCEVCHTRTKNTDGTARARNNAATDWSKHYTSDCIACHPHGKGFAAGESGGGASCAGCHSSIWNRMQAAGGSTYKHTLAVNTFTDDTVAWANPLSSNAATVRSCVNMCHDDHPHTATDDANPTLHYNLAYDDATNNASRASTTRTVATKARTDFDNTLANGGMCISCHRNPVESGASPAHPAIVQANYAASAHNTASTTPGGAWQYTLHDGSNFTRNCTKCHWDATDGTTPAVSGKTAIGAVHGNTNPSLLMGTTNPAGTPATFVCYRCHGNGTTGTDYSSKNIATQTAKAYRHPTDSDTVHNSVTEFNTAAFGNTLGVTGRHANCQDCHDPHEAKAGLSPSPGNLAGGALNGAWGAQLSTSPAFWTDTATANFTKKTLVSGTDLEATLCFKCHTKYYWGVGAPPTAPSGGSETDVAKEFNPNNVGNYAGAWSAGKTAGGFHPILATAGSNLGAVTLTNLVTTNFAWSTTTRNLMTCSDCHASNATTDPGGPHGSTAGYILKGPNTTWNGTIAVNGSNPWPAGTFCANCHSNTYANSRFPGHTNGSHNIACWNCHSAIPHGGPRPGMLNPGAGTNTTNLPAIAGWDGMAPYWQGQASNRLYLVSYPANNTTNWAQGNCGCNGTGH